jgi:hypothetical protein
MHQPPRPRLPRNAWFATLGAALALAGCQTIRAPDGVRAYGNISVNAESADAGGMEIELRRDGTRTSAFVVVCEGGCHGAEGRDVVSDGDTLSLVRRDPLAPSDRPVKFVFRRKGDRLVVQAPDWAKGQVLKRTRPGRTREWSRFH